MMNATALSTLNRVNHDYRDREITLEGDAFARNENQQETSTEAFSMILNVARSAYVDPSRLTLSNPASAMQMFEPNASDSHDHRQSMMQQQARADQFHGGADHNDRSSIQARMIRQDSQQDIDPSLKNARSINNESRLPQPVILTNTQSQSANHEKSKMESPHASVKNNNLQSAVQKTAEQSDSRLDFEPRRSADFTTTKDSNQAITASAAASVRPATSQGTSSSQIAQQIGQIIGASRGGEVESARAIQSAQPTSHAQSKSFNSKPDANTLTKSSDDAKSPSLIETKSDSASRSEFDQLVRSIRMKPGLWQSSAKIRLNPPSLGTLNVDVRLVGKKIEINVKTESLEAAQRISQQASKLISALEQHGIAVERFDVSTNDVTHQTRHESESSQTDASAHHNQESNDHSMQNRMTGEVVELPDQPIENMDALELNTVAERRIDIKV